MEKTYNPALIQRTQRYMETHSISQNQFAAKVNLSSAALSSYLNQKYKGSVEAVERQLSEFFKLDEEAEAAAEKTASLLPRAAYVPTSISEDVCQSIRFAQLEHCMVVLHGDAGVGKSKGAQKAPLGDRLCVKALPTLDKPAEPTHQEIWLDHVVLPNAAALEFYSVAKKYGLDNDKAYHAKFVEG